MKTCTNCDKPKQDSEFCKDKRSKDGLTSWCKKCKTEAELERSRTVDGALKQLANHAKESAEARLKKKGREEAGMCQIDYEYVKQLYEKKQGRCYLSGVPMTTEPGLFKMSLERPEQSKGYIPGNAELICLAFNTRLPWTKEDLRAVVENYLSGDFPPVVIPDDPPKPPKKRTKIIEEIRDGQTYVRCTWCSDFKVSSDFTKDRKDGCSKCRAERKQERLNTKRGFFQKMLCSATSHTRARNENESRCKTTSNFTFDELNALYESQGGRCAVSKMPLEVGPNKKWACSLDRLDVNIGYLPDNVRVVAALFQATDNSVNLKDPAEASGFGWTEERFEMVIDTARKEFGL